MLGSRLAAGTVSQETSDTILEITGPIAGLLAVSGAILAYALSEHATLARNDEPYLVPVVEVSGDGLRAGAFGRF